MDLSQRSQSSSTASYKHAPTRTVSVDGVDFVYRRLGPAGGVPVVFLNHLAAVSWTTGIRGSSTASLHSAT